ncbi:hypothetical protein Snoj_71840 [Streptomyces nojiriensis]|uniref:Uncharacterized protein n=1 Tax=Streptomyces nojiriensis TaxID=66374 RepID=A0ABQ3SYQ9_9ACTN|nr:hypothetical protein JYK04_04618 [Streptomyces nojiriensis]GGS01315.1 hypothetical protein GCM10010205_32710 [Streptomyces nojiriensis]GHI73266.1 hypothetical protein Snoj_71840 [Streptomyces nojiriensis]
MAVFYLLLTAAIVLIIVGATVEGMLYLVSAGVLLLIADVLYLAVRSVLRRRRPEVLDAKHRPVSPSRREDRAGSHRPVHAAGPSHGIDVPEATFASFLLCSESRRALSFSR